MVGFLWDFYGVSLKGHSVLLPGPREERELRSGKTARELRENRGGPDSKKRGMI